MTENVEVSAELPALSDIPHDAHLEVRRIENMAPAQAQPIIMDMMRSVYPHEQVYGSFCPVHGYIAAPPREVFDYLSDTRSLEEWTYSLRGFTETDEPGLWSARDRLGDNTTIFCRTVAHPDAMTVDYHCAWDQGRHLWMIYLMRVIDADVVLNKPGSVVTWMNCRHPFYDRNPYPETAPVERTVWVGDLWDMFSAGHRLELENLTAICEYRAAQHLPITPGWMK